MKKKTKEALINIGSGIDTTILNYAKKIIKFFKADIKITKIKKCQMGLKENY